MGSRAPQEQLFTGGRRFRAAPAQLPGTSYSHLISALPAPYAPVSCSEVRCAVKACGFGRVRVASPSPYPRLWQQRLGAAPGPRPQARQPPPSAASAHFLFPGCRVIEIDSVEPFQTGSFTRRQALQGSPCPWWLHSPFCFIFESYSVVWV